MNDNIKMQGFFSILQCLKEHKTNTLWKFDPLGPQVKLWGAGAPPELGPLNRAVSDFWASCVKTLLYQCMTSRYVNNTAENKNRGICQQNRKTRQKRNS